MNNDLDSISLLNEQLKHISYIIDSRFILLDEKLVTLRQFVDDRFSSIDRIIQDHESRIRDATEGVTQFKLFFGLASGGSTVMSIFALIKSIFHV